MAIHRPKHLLTQGQCSICLDITAHADIRGSNVCTFNRFRSSAQRVRSICARAAYAWHLASSCSLLSPDSCSTSAAEIIPSLLSCSILRNHSTSPDSARLRPSKSRNRHAEISLRCAAQSAARCTCSSAICFWMLSSTRHSKRVARLAEHAPGFTGVPSNGSGGSFHSFMSTPAGAAALSMSMYAALVQYLTSKLRVLPSAKAVQV